MVKTLTSDRQVPPKQDFIILYIHARLVLIDKSAEGCEIKDQCSEMINMRAIYRGQNFNYRRGRKQFICNYTCKHFTHFY